MPARRSIGLDPPRSRIIVYSLASIAQGVLLGVGLLALVSPLFSPNVPVRLGKSSPIWSFFAALSPGVFLSIAAACLLSVAALALLRWWLRRRWGSEVGMYGE